MAHPAETLTENKRRLELELPTSGPRVSRLLELGGFPPSHISRSDGPRGQAPWLIQTKPADHIRQTFGLAPELLVVLVPGREAQARDIEKAEQALRGSLRLDPGLVLVLAADGAARSKLAPVTQRTNRQYVFIDLESTSSVSDPDKWLRTELRAQLGSADLFAPNRPVVGWDFFGRTREFERLRRYLFDGKPVGLYGLRKIGKTSLALRSLSQLVAEGATLGLHLDMQALGPRDRSLAGFMRSLIRALDEALKKGGIRPNALGLAPEFASLRQLREMSADEAMNQGFDALESAIDWARADQARRVIVFVDEYERLFEPELFPLVDARAILDYFRGQVQTYPGSFNFMIAGLTRRAAAQSRIGQHQNPLFSFLVDFPLAGLEREELKELLTKIGRRAGLRFSHCAREFIWEQSGGHPALAREYGRIVDQSVSIDEKIVGAVVDKQRLLDLHDAFQVQVEVTMQEIYYAIRRVDECAPFALLPLASAPRAELGLPSSSVEELRRLGVIVRNEDGWEIAIGSFASWLSRNVASPVVTGAALQ